MEELNVPIFAQAKIEYTNQLVDILYPHLFDGIKSIYEESKIIYNQKKDTPILLLFRELLEKVPIWNGEIVESECSRIINNSKCDWIDDLITAVFISHTKILTSIGPNQSFNKINVTIPKTVNFIHKTYINIAREIWKNPYLFNENVPGHEYQRNSKEVENIIKQCIESTIRKLLPIKEILKEHLDTYDSDNVTSKDEIKLLLKEELKDLKNQIIQSSKEDTEDKEDKEDTEDTENVVSDDGISETQGSDASIKEDIKREYEEELENNSIEDTLHKLLEDTSNENAPNEDVPNENAPNEDVQNQIDIHSLPDDPSDDVIDQNCKDIVVNDITIPVGDKGESEIHYDNVDIVTDTEGKGDDNLDKMLVNMEPVEDITNTKKSITINETEDKKSSKKTNAFELNNIFDSESNEPKVEVHKLENSTETKKDDNPFSFLTDDELSDKPKEELSDKPKEEPFSFLTEEPEKLEKTEKPEKPKEESEKPEKPKEESFSFQPEVNGPEVKGPEPETSITVQNDIDETSSLANFFQDMQQIVDDKNIVVDSDKNFTLFEDANEVEVR